MGLRHKPNPTSSELLTTAESLIDTATTMLADAVELAGSEANGLFDAASQLAIQGAEASDRQRAAEALLSKLSLT